VLDNGRLGRLVPPGDPEALADSLLAVLRDADLRRELTTRAFSGVEMFAWPRVATDIMTAYRDAMEESAAPGRLAWEAGTPPFSPVSATEGQ
jgi:phosphatidylinositol alpha-mannosyltransferase